MKRSRTSEMWNFFTVVDSEFAKCDLCGKSLSYKSSTSNLKKHLQHRHVHVHLPSVVVEQRSSEPNLNQNTPVEELPVEVTQETGSVDQGQAVPSTSRQQPVQSFPSTSRQPVQSSIASYVPKRIGVSQKKMIDGELLKLFTKDYQPFSVVEDTGFRSYSNAMNSGYEIPSRKHVSDVLLPAAYRIAKAKLEEKLSAVKTVCLTTDCWTSAANEGYIAVTAHFISEDFTMQSGLLGCAQITGPHDTANLSAAIIKITDQFQVTSKVVLIVTDNAANIKSAAEVLKWKHFGCYAHTLNLIVQKALRHFQEVHQKVKSIVAFFKRSCLATEKLVTYQRNSGITNVKKVIQDMPTRWNSTLLMLERIVELQDAVKSSIALSNVDLPTLTSNEWTICKELCTVLKPFHQVTTQLSAESYPTGSQVIVLTRGLSAVCEQLSKRPFEDVTKTVIGALTNGLKERFPNIEMSKSIGVATLLDPRFKTLGFGNYGAAENAKRHLTDLVAQKLGEARATTITQSQETVASSSATTDELSAWNFLDEIVKRTQPRGTPQSGAMVEVQRYLDSPVINRSEDPLTWWRENQYIFPNIAKVVKERFNIVATSVPCERIFSKTGQIINDRRTRLHPSKVEQLVFLNVNDG